MEQITPQYKRGKYINRKNRKKRIAILCLCVGIVLVAAALLLFFFWNDLFPVKEAVPAETTPAAQSDPAATDTNGVPQTEPSAEASEPISGTQVTIAGGRLLLTYDDEALSLTQDGVLTTLLDKAAGEETLRMDVQKLPGKLGMLRDNEMEQIAIALLQAYYYHPPQAAEVELTVTRNDKNEFAAQMQVPAIDDAPAAVCSVRLLAAGDELWAAVLLQPEGADSAALADAFRWLTPTEENG